MEDILALSTRRFGNTLGYVNATWATSAMLNMREQNLLLGDHANLLSLLETLGFHSDVHYPMVSFCAAPCFEYDGAAGYTKARHIPKAIPRFALTVI